MKKTVSIFLLIAFIVNTVGFYFFLEALRYEASQELTFNLDSGKYSDDETITFKVPFVLPYHTEQKDFKRVDGTFKYGEEYYKLVKQRLENDTLFVVCIKNMKEKQYAQAMTDLVKTSNDLPSSQPTSKLLNNFTKDFLGGSICNTSSSSGWSFEVSHHKLSFNLLDQDSEVLSPPPDTLA